LGKLLGQQLGREGVFTEPKGQKGRNLGGPSRSAEAKRRVTRGGTISHTKEIQFQKRRGK